MLYTLTNTLQENEFKYDTFPVTWQLFAFKVINQRAVKVVKFIFCVDWL